MAAKDPFTADSVNTSINRTPRKSSLEDSFDLEALINEDDQEHDNSPLSPLSLSLSSLSGTEDDHAEQVASQAPEDKLSQERKIIQDEAMAPLHTQTLEERLKRERIAEDEEFERELDDEMDRIQHGSKEILTLNQLINEGESQYHRLESEKENALDLAHRERMQREKSERTWEQEKAQMIALINALKENEIKTKNDMLGLIPQSHPRIAAASPEIQLNSTEIISQLKHRLDLLQGENKATQEQLQAEQIERARAEQSANDAINAKMFEAKKRAEAERSAEAAAIAAIEAKKRAEEEAKVRLEAELLAEEIKANAEIELEELQERELQAQIEINEIRDRLATANAVVATAAASSDPRDIVRKQMGWRKLG